MSKEHCRKLESMYLQANVNTKIYDTTDCKIAEGSSEIGLIVDEKYFHALGAIHGSVYFKLLDDAAFFAVNSKVHDVFVLTTSFNINLLRPITQGKIKAVGRIKYGSEKHFVAESTLYDENGKADLKPMAVYLWVCLAFLSMLLRFLWRHNCNSPALLTYTSCIIQKHYLHYLEFLSALCTMDPIK